ncbi:MAG: ABC transporter ATP-binding protein [Chloroflexi bacterium]|jgi:ATP-binding cassette subfamily B protein|nr:ABC transporter ATP-binding protein [Chloroflexota bacterium]
MNHTNRGYRALLGRYLGPYRGRAVLLAALLFTSTGLQLANPQLLRRFIDGAQAGLPLRVLTITAVVYLSVALVRRALDIGAAYVGNDLGWRATNALRGDLAEHCLSLDLPFHKTHTPGALIERIDGDVLAMANFFSQFVVRIIGSVLRLVGVLAVLYVEDWRLGLSLTAFCAVALGVLIGLRGHAVAASAAEREESAKLFGFIEERLTGLEDIRANGAGAYAMRRFYEVSRRFSQVSQQAWIKRSVFWRSSMGLFSVGTALAFALSAALYLSGRATLGTAYLLTSYVSMLFYPIELLAQQLQDLQKAGAGLHRVQELLGTKRVIVDGTVSALPSGALSVTFRDVSFVYEDGDQQVLSGLDFRLEPGASLGLLGRTGSGKTTLSRLLFRLYDPSGGSIRLGGTDLRDLTLEALRTRVGMVTQDVQLFQASVRDNLTLFDPAVPDETILALIEDLGLGEWLARLPDGLDSELSAGGGGLSAGEAQLLAFARVFLKDPGLVILDEPSSRLDPATERLIDRAMMRLVRDRTAIIIAHRLGTVHRVDEIMVMEDGCILEHGPRARLANDPNSRFAGLLRTGMEESFA